MTLYWDETESSLSLELSVTKNAGKQSYFFFNFMLLDTDFQLPGFLMLLQWNATRQACCPWAGVTVLPTAAGSPGHLCQLQDHTQCWASASNSAPLSQPHTCPQGALGTLYPSLLFHPCLVFCRGGCWGRAGKAAELGDRCSSLDMAWHLQNCCSRWQAEKGCAPSLSKVKLSPSISFLLTFPTNFKVRRMGIKIGNARDICVLSCPPIDLPFYCCWPSAVLLWRSNTAWSIFPYKGPSNRCHQHQKQMFLPHFALHHSVPIHSGSLLSNQR